ncbi:uncharacterized protein LOC108736637 isoform X2 [Agrilus planipennis]|uniref:Uncharacterized protein LOC108736637 isoform X2 n=1 Tax=Agrilus planipennis TaxID=224129 RepID=A0A1W4WL54_AGRPL|nr:uncharacterized protein LOC108736637 isoform X2 [Agrilus planipennis]
MCKRSWITVIMTVIFGSNLTSSVKITRFHVPSKVSHSALLDCKYNLEGEQLYDVTWYKDDQQFFRCRPNGEIITYVIEAIKLDYSENAILGSCQVTLMALTPKSSGIYKCEVISEGPTFNSDSKSVYLDVVDAPLIQEHLFTGSSSINRHNESDELPSTSDRSGSTSGNK